MKILNLDINSKNTKIGQLEKCDTAKLLCTLEDKDYSNSIIRILGKKADKTFVEQIVEVENNKIDIELNEQFTSCEGITRIEINIASEGNEWSSNENYFYVSNTLNSEIIESADNLETLEKVDKYVTSAISDLKEFEIIKDDLTVANTEMKKDELGRKGNELLRIEAEKTRLKNEILRDTTEEDRKVNELDRITSENDRKVNEVNRKLAENLRNNAETVRATAELQRQDTFEVNEGLRNSNENIRIKNEEDRNKHFETATNLENSRKIAEDTRKTNELDRKSNEEVRKTSEDGRKAAEENREKTYTNFNNSEVTRKANEETRIAAEKVRVNAEANRDSRYDVAENKRNTDFGTNEAVRSNAFISSEKNRSAAFIENEEVRNAAFIAKENMREENEVTRKTDENLRVTAETKRVDVEKTRVNNEVARVNSETLRKSAEVNRVNAEASRVVAEENREEKVTEIKDSQHKISTELSEITQEIKEARADYFGKEYPTLKEKEDAEYERVHIDNSKGMYMPTSSNTGAIKVENSIEGKTKELTVNGRTLQNINSNKNEEVIATSHKNERLDSPLIKPLTKYTCFVTIKDDVAVNVANKDTYFRIESNVGGVFGGFTGQVSTSYTTHSFLFTTSSELGIIDINRRMSVGTKQYTKDIIILEGDHTANPPTEYFEGIKSLGEEENKISILSRGKNLIGLNAINIESGTITGAIGQELPSQTRIRTDFIEMEGNTDRFLTLFNRDEFKVAIRYYDNNKSIVNTNENSLGSFIKDKNIKCIDNGTVDYSFIRLVFANKDDSDISPNDKGKIKIQLEEGAVGSSYVPYQGQDKKDILLPVTNGAKGLPNGVCDEAYWNGDCLEKIKKIDLGKISSSMVSLSWGETDTLIGFNIQTDEVVGIKTYGSTAISNLLPYTEYQVLTTKNYEWFSYNSTNKVLCIKILKSKLKTADINGLVDYLNSTSMCIYAELEDHILHKAVVLTSHNLTTFKEITHVSCLNKIAPSEISAKFPVNVGATLSRLTSENKDLINENISLVNKSQILTTENEFQQLEIDTNMLATIDLFEMMLAVGTTRSVKGGDSMVEVYVSMIIKGKKKLEDVPAIIRAQVEQMLKDLGVIT